MIRLPDSITRLLPDEPYLMDKIGMSSSQVLLFSDRVLKIQPVSWESLNEHRMLLWLQGRLEVPKVLAYEVVDGTSYLLMSRLKGTMACDQAAMEDPQKLVKLLASGLKRLWMVDIKGCPTLSNAEQKLSLAKANIESGRVDIAEAEPDTYGGNGFSDPLGLWNWLVEHKPKEELVFSHGDYCLPNVFVEGDRVSGFLDLGSAGLADKWQDIALCYRSLKHNYDGTYGETPRPDFDPNTLFQELGIEPDWNNIKYYLLLDELF
jgi:kanamycin kinase/aminoglycoside 3'-phosphotransferase-3